MSRTDQCQDESMYSSQESLDLWSSSGASQQSGEPISCFKKLPSLAAVFTKIGYDKNRQTVATCSGCFEQLITNRASRFAGHVKRCKSLSESTKLAVAAEVRTNLRSNAPGKDFDLNLELTRMIVRNCLSLRVLDCPHLKTICERGFPDTRMISREELSSRYIPIISENVESAFFSALKTQSDYILSIEFDHWQGKCKRSILGMVATLNDGKRYLLDLEDVSLKTHSSLAVVESLKKVLGSIPSLKINSIISDSASNCKGARERLVEDKEYSHIIQHRCFAHYLNLIGKRFSEDGCTDFLLECATELSSYISNNTRLSAKLRNSNTNKVSKATPVRWYSNVDMLESLRDAREEVLKHVGCRRDREAERLQTLNDSLFWDDLNRTIAIMRPLANCIAIAERADGCLSEAVHELLEFASSIFSQSWEDELILGAISSFLSYFNSKKLGDELGLMLAAYFLDRRYSMNYITKKGGAIIIRALVMIAKRMKMGKDVIESILFKEVLDYREGRENFGIPAGAEEKPRDWWNNQPESFLKHIAMRLANLRSSSANIERTFSILGLIQGERRMNFSMASLTDLARAKISMIESRKDQELYDSIQPEDSERLDTAGWSAPHGSRDIRVDRFRARLATRVSGPSDDFGWGSWFPGPSPSKLASDELRGHFEEFSSLIDFAITNDIQPMYVETSEDSNDMASEDLMAERLLREDRW